MNTKNSKEKKSHIVLNLLQRLGLISSNKHVVLKKLSIYYTRGNIRQHYKTNKFKIIVQRGMISVNYLMVLIQYWIFKVISSIS